MLIVVILPTRYRNCGLKAPPKTDMLWISSVPSMPRPKHIILRRPLEPVGRLYVLARVLRISNETWRRPVVLQRGKDLTWLCRCVTLGSAVPILCLLEVSAHKCYACDHTMPCRHQRPTCTNFDNRVSARSGVCLRQYLLCVCSVNCYSCDGRRTLGPLLVMVGYMLIDIIIFILLLILVLIGYGAATLIILYPFRGPDAHTFRDVIYRPTFMVIRIYLSHDSSPLITLTFLFSLVARIVILTYNSRSGTASRMGNIVAVMMLLTNLYLKPRWRRSSANFSSTIFVKIRIVLIAISNRMFRATINDELPLYQLSLLNTLIRDQIPRTHIIAHNRCIVTCTRCTWNSYYALILLVVYLTVAQILLVNLLIAMMASRYEQVRL